MGSHVDTIAALATGEQMCLKKFSFEEIKTATNDFERQIGEGGLIGPVFLGAVEGKTFTPNRDWVGRKVAVKMLKKDAFQDDSQWVAEVNRFGRLNHFNLVKLYGYCLAGDLRLLVYDATFRGSLEDVLFDDCSETISFGKRLMIASEAARGLAYLHRDDIHIIHRDFKSSNILIDIGFDTMISDFGLARDGPPYGYVDPIYLASGHLTTKTDVYGFGVVLLEILSGRRAMDTSLPQEEQNLVEWAMHNFKISQNFLSNFMDKKLDGQYSREKALMVVEIAQRCLSEDLKRRPNMNEVAFALEVVFLYEKSPRPF